MRTLVLSAAIVALAAPLAAQAPRWTPPDSGSRVRYTRIDDREWRRGRLLTLDASAIRVRRDTTGELERIALDSLRTLQRSVARSAGEGAQRGALVGLLTGASLTFVTTLLVRASDADEHCDDCFISATAAVGVLGVLGTGVLTLGGALIGAAAPGEAWEPVELPGRRSPRNRAELRIGLRLPWSLAP